MELPKSTEEEIQAKSYAIGTISIDKFGIWHCTYIGHHKVGKKTYFGNGIESRLNIRELFEIVGSRLNNDKSVYMDKITEVENEQHEIPTSDNSSKY